MNFEIIDEITNIEIIAVGNSIRELERLRKIYGLGRWRKVSTTTTTKKKLQPRRAAIAGCGEAATSVAATRPIGKMSEYKIAAPCGRNG